VLKPRLDEGLNQRDPDIAEADDADFRRFVLNRFLQHDVTGLEKTGADERRRSVAMRRQSNRRDLWMILL